MLASALRGSVWIQSSQNRREGAHPKGGQLDHRQVGTATAPDPRASAATGHHIAAGPVPAAPPAASEATWRTEEAGDALKRSGLGVRPLFPFAPAPPAPKKRASKAGKKAAKKAAGKKKKAKKAKKA